MKISTKLRGSAVLIIGIIVIFVGVVSYFSLKAAQAGERNEIAQKILENLVQSAALRVEYGLTGEERPKVQWYVLQDTFNEILDQAGPLFTEPANQTLYIAIRESQGERKTIFDALVVAKEQSRNSEVVARLNNQLALSAQERLGLATQLAKLSSDEHSAFHQKLKYTTGFFGLLAIFLTLISYFVSRRISSSLSVLQQEFTRISSLDFYPTTTTTTTGKNSNDEIGQLARAFNTMVLKLKESYTGLEEKVRDRTQNLENAKIAARNVLEDLQVEREKLAEAKAKDEAMLASIGDGCVVVDRKGKIMVMNERAATMLKLDKESVLGKDYRDIWSVADESGNIIPSERRPIQIVLTSGKKLTTTTYWYIRSDRTRFPVAITVAPILHEGAIEGVEGVILIFRDITREKEIDKTKSEFIATASHQLRTPLTGIRWVVERLLKTQKLSMEAMEYLGDIHASTERLANLVELLLNASRLEGGSMSITPKPLDAVEFLKEFFSECTPLAAKKDIKLLFKIYPKSLIVTTDQSAFRNIVQSLVSNAFEYTPEKGEVELALEKKDKTFLFTVRDTGIGIPKEEQAMIFEKFMRASNAKRVKTDGTGLGLYIAKQATEFLGGKIWFESAEGKGAKFFVELPLVSESKEGIKAFT